MNIVIPMAGAGSRFEEAIRFQTLIEVNGQPMIQTVVSNLNIDGTYIFSSKAHYEKYNLKNLLEVISQIVRLFKSMV